MSTQATRIDALESQMSTLVSLVTQLVTQPEQPKAAQAKAAPLTAEQHAAKAVAYLPKYEANAKRTLTQPERSKYVAAWVAAALASKSPVSAARKAVPRS